MSLPNLARHTASLPQTNPTPPGTVYIVTSPTCLGVRHHFPLPCLAYDLTLLFSIMTIILGVGVMGL